jgi:hypothetical protein
VAGYNATGQVTSERRKKPFQLARGAIDANPKLRNSIGIQARSLGFVPRREQLGFTPEAKAKSRLGATVGWLVKLPE